VTTRRRWFQRFISIRSNILTDKKMITGASVIIFIVPRPSCEKWSHNLRSQKWPRDLHSQKMVTWPAHLTQRFLRSTCPVFTSVSLSCLWLQSGPPIYDCTYLLRYLDIHEVSPGYQCVITLKYKIHILRWVETCILW
jgi:hypothetical protein